MEECRVVLDGVTDGLKIDMARVMRERRVITARRLVELVNAEARSSKNVRHWQFAVVTCGCCPLCRCSRSHPAAVFLCDSMRRRGPRCFPSYRPILPRFVSRMHACAQLWMRRALRLCCRLHDSSTGISSSQRYYLGLRLAFLGNDS